VTLETVIYGLVMGSMILAVVAWFQVGGSLIDMEKFLYLFGRILPSIALLISMVLRMIPLFVRRYKEVSDGQAGLGRRAGDMRPWARLRLAMKKASIVVSWSLENSINTTSSMESRGYGSGRRSQAHLFRFVTNDGWMLAVLGVLASLPTAMILTGRLRASYFPYLDFRQIKGLEAVALVFMGLYMCLPVAIDLLAGREEGGIRDGSNSRI